MIADLLLCVHTGVATPVQLALLEAGRDRIDRQSAELVRPGTYPGAVGEPKLSAWEVFLRAHAAVLPLLEAELLAAGMISLNQYDVLVNLEDASGPLRVSELVDRVVLSQPSVSRLVQGLQYDGLVERVRDPSDRRGTLVQITAMGSAALGRAREVHAGGIERHFYAHLNPEQVEVVRCAMSQVLASAWTGRRSGGSLG